MFPSHRHSEIHGDRAVESRVLPGHRLPAGAAYRLLLFLIHQRFLGHVVKPQPWILLNLLRSARRVAQLHFHIALAAGQVDVPDSDLRGSNPVRTGFKHQAAPRLCMLGRQADHKTPVRGVCGSLGQQTAQVVRQPCGHNHPVRPPENPDFLFPAKNRPVREKGCRLQHTVSPSFSV